jgi:hypothetical protein
MTMKALLALPSTKFADKQKQLLRQELQQSLTHDSQRSSTEQQAELQRRQTEANTEGWRDKTIDKVTISMESTKVDGSEQLAFDRAAPTISADDSADTTNFEESDLGHSMSNFAEDEEEGEPVLDSDSSLTSKVTDILDIERAVLSGNPALTSSSPKSLKRSLDVHAPTIFTHESLGRPVKVAKTADLPLVDIQQTQQVPTRASGIGLVPSSTSLSFNTTTLRSSVPNMPNLQMINRDGGSDFTITGSDGLNLKVTGLISERRLQGVINSTFGITGRSRVAQIEDSINDAIRSGRRIIATIAFLVNDAAGATSNYSKFCDEYTRNQRIGMCIVSGTVQLYIVPPSLQSTITCLKPFSISNSNAMGTRRLLWAVAVVKNEVGPDHYTAESRNPTRLLGKYIAGAVLIKSLSTVLVV